MLDAEDRATRLVSIASRDLHNRSRLALESLNVKADMCKVIMNMATSIQSTKQSISCGLIPTGPTSSTPELGRLSS
eukprot:1065323-Pleurochrysis_carterae.AAC.1